MICVKATDNYIYLQPIVQVFYYVIFHVIIVSASIQFYSLFCAFVYCPYTLFHYLEIMSLLTLGSHLHLNLDSES
jgi:hypothetical protein